MIGEIYANTYHCPWYILYTREFQIKLSLGDEKRDCIELSQGKGKKFLVHSIPVLSFLLISTYFELLIGRVDLDLSQRCIGRRRSRAFT